MATYDDLKNQLQALIDRDDARTQSVNNTTIDMLDSFIERGEQNFYRSEAAMTPPFEKLVTYSLPPNSNVNALRIPEDYYSLRYATATEGNRTVKLKRVTLEEVIDHDSTVYSWGLPPYIAYGSYEWLIPSNSNTVTVKVYYHGNLKELKQAGEDGDTDHWLLNQGKDVMLYLAAAEAAIYYDFDPAQLQTWTDKAEQLKIQMIQQYDRQLISGGVTKRKSRYRR